MYKYMYRWVVVCEGGTGGVRGERKRMRGRLFFVVVFVPCMIKGAPSSRGSVSTELTRFFVFNRGGTAREYGRTIANRIGQLLGTYEMHKKKGKEAMIRIF